MKKLAHSRFFTTIITLALTGITLSSSVVIPAAIAESSNNNSSTNQQEAKKSTSILEALLSLLKSPENRLITRGDELCPMSPGNIGEQVVWNNRPLFIWAGKTSKSKISLYSPTVNFNYEQDDKLLWQKTLESNTETVVYDGEKLEPGLTYDWHLKDANKDYRLTFVLMEQDQRNAIAQDLIALENELKNTNVSVEDIAIAKADYFANKKLWSDALQELYAVENPSPMLVNKTKAISSYLCQDNNSNNISRQ
ncbi:MAG: hypothetical protein Tsb0014_30350 [Pleurocapsa sp.]